jgi:hypothetical protein
MSSLTSAWKTINHPSDQECYLMMFLLGGYQEKFLSMIFLHLINRHTFIIVLSYLSSTLKGETLKDIF